MSTEPVSLDGHTAWSFHREDVEVRFFGKAAEAPRGASGGPLESRPRAWLEQIHSSQVLDARQGLSGRGDGLVTHRSGLVLTVVTADCVPVLLANSVAVAAVHAGWRGIAQSILPRAVERLTPYETSAWIGPAIGPCCYEVGNDVADSVCQASRGEVARTGPRGKPHLDLQAAARAQLERSGVVQIHTVEACTRCDERLWSYRRDGGGAGRNVAAIWRTSATDLPDAGSRAGSES